MDRAGLMAGGQRSRFPGAHSETVSLKATKALWESSSYTCFLPITQEQISLLKTAFR